MDEISGIMASELLCQIKSNEFSFQDLLVNNTTTKTKEEMIEHFSVNVMNALIEIEDYESCAYLKNLLEKINIHS